MKTSAKLHVSNYWFGDFEAVFLGGSSFAYGQHFTNLMWTAFEQYSPDEHDELQDILFGDVYE